MNGAETLLRTLVNSGLDTCFMNPGTSEMQFVAAADKQNDLRCVLGLFEGIVSGAADGYGRMAGKPAATLLHLGPGLANALANFHNAQRAATPIVNIVGDHATYHKQFDAPLASNVSAYASPVSGWIKEIESPADVPQLTQEAVQASLQAPGQIATLIVPADTAWNESVNPASGLISRPDIDKSDAAAISEAAAALRSGEPTVMLIKGHALSEDGLAFASRIAGKFNVRVYFDTFTARVERGAGRAAPERLPYFPELIVETLAGTRHLIVVGSKPPVGFFAYPDKPSWLTPEDCEVHTLARPDQDGLDALQRLAQSLGVDQQAATLMEYKKLDLPQGDLNPETIGMAVAALLPENAIVAEEAITSGFALMPMSVCSPAHDWLMVPGGAIGGGMPMATGAAIACPDRKVLNLQADGSAMYTLQALWTQARENLNVTTIIFANREYKILNIEFDRVGAGEQGRIAHDMFSLDQPALDWVKLAGGMGVTAKRVTELDDFCKTLAAYLNEPGPNLIEAVL
ncbi:MAG: acetolactate synthase large subunit [Gammaproteobacteria bacterium]|nr:acetolactate synthase large subunit [Gammaproteobacteria bacterium]